MRFLDINWRPVFWELALEEDMEEEGVRETLAARRASGCACLVTFDGVVLFTPLAFFPWSLVRFCASVFDRVHVLAASLPFLQRLTKTMLSFRPTHRTHAVWTSTPPS